MIKNEYTYDEFVKEYPNDDACLEKIFQMTYGKMECCPKCKRTNGFKKIKGRKIYQCRSCYYQISPMAACAFKHCRIPLRKVFYALFIFTVSKNGVSAMELSRAINVTHKTALNLLKKIRLHIVNDESPITGEAQIDECFVGGLNKFRHHDKKVPKCQGRAYIDKVPVVGLVDTSTGRAIVKVVENVKKETLHPIVKKYLIPGSKLLSDEYKGYKGLEKYYDHKKCDHKGRLFLSEDGGSTNKVENLWSCLKRTIKNSYIRVSRKHMHLYTKEVVFRYNNKSNANIFRELLSCLIF